jgi:hypothetical protein
MAKRPSPHTIVIDGQTIYLVTVEEYESLAQTRRQVGSYSTRLNVLRQNNRIDADLINEIRALLADHPLCAQTPDRELHGCTLCSIRDAITRRSPPPTPTPQ